AENAPRFAFRLSGRLADLPAVDRERDPPSRRAECAVPPLQLKHSTVTLHYALPSSATSRRRDTPRAPRLLLSESPHPSPPREPSRAARAPAESGSSSLPCPSP